ncbi:hypothetical protein [Alkalicoccus urumqiensis]|nr:hypothetical protein [Alkalicoccus urumqiensis]
MNKLLDAGLLFCTKEQLLEERALKIRSAKSFEKRHLNKAMPDKMTVYRVVDSNKEKFKLSKVNEHKVEIVNVVTKPEIEMLIIIAEGKYDDYQNKAGRYGKPSDYVKSQLKYPHAKSAAFINDYFRDVTKLTEAIREYRRLHPQEKKAIPLADLLSE